MPNLHVEIIAPSRRVFRGEAQGVKAPGVEGSFEVLYNHAPLISAFEVGPIRVTATTGEEVFFATSGGIIEVIDNHVTVLAETAEPASEIDVERARAAEERALELLEEEDSAAERRRAESALERARNRLRIAMGQVGRRSRT
ncbi:MAG: F0F1 ATP synthase subunit epsilon [Rhodothermales bacterium]